VGYNFLDCDRDQRFLLPVDMRDWLDPDHPCLFVIDIVDKLDLSDFYAPYRSDGWGRAAFNPKMMVELILYAYMVGERSTRVIERLCKENAAFRILCANRPPDHTTIARFTARHEDALRKLFDRVLSLCVEAGLVTPGVVAIDGTKMGANAGGAKNLTPEQIRAATDRIFDEARRINEEEDRLYGDARGDELPEHLRDRKRRLEWLDEQLREGNANSNRINETDPDSRVMMSPKGFVQGYNAQLAVTETQVVVAQEVTNDVIDRWRFQPMVTQAKDNLEAAGAPDAITTVVADTGYFTNDNVEADLGCDVLIAPAAAKDLDSLEPPEDGWADYEARKQELEQEDERRIEVVERAVAQEITMREARDELDISTPHIYFLRKRYVEGGADAVRRRPPPPPKKTPRSVMLTRYATEEGRATYAKRAILVEPVIGQTKEARGFRRFMRRGLTACATEWALMMTTHNLRKLWAAAPAASRSIFVAFCRYLRTPHLVTL
jgi:transposase